MHSGLFRGAVGFRTAVCQQGCRASLQRSRAQCKVSPDLNSFCCPTRCGKHSGCVDRKAAAYAFRAPGAVYWMRPRPRSVSDRWQVLRRPVAFISRRRCTALPSLSHCRRGKVDYRRDRCLRIRCMCMVDRARRRGSAWSQIDVHGAALMILL